MFCFIRVIREIRGCLFLSACAVYPVYMAKKKIRVELRKNRTKPPRDRTWTQKFQEPGREDEAASADERVRAKGDLSRHRTIIQDEGATNDGASPTEGMPAAGPADCKSGRLIRMHG